jgi:hypothetical protein
MSRPKKRTETGRLTKEAAEIVIEMIKEGVVTGGLETFGVGVIPAEFEKDLSGDPSDFQPYFISDAGWFTRRLAFEGGVSRPEDVRRFELKSDRKEFKRRWRERYPKETKPETQVETKSESEIKLTYPLFAKSKKNGIVILFTSKDRGICVKSDWSVHALGECHNNWVHATDTDQWQHITFAEAESEIFGEKK